MPDEETDVLTVDEVAEVLRVSIRTVRRLVREGELAGRKVGRSYRVHRDSLAAYLGVLEFKREEWLRQRREDEATWTKEEV